MNRNLVLKSPKTTVTLLFKDKLLTFATVPGVVILAVSYQYGTYRACGYPSKKYFFSRPSFCLRPFLMALSTLSLGMFTAWHSGLLALKGCFDPGLGFLLFFNRPITIWSLPILVKPWTLRTIFSFYVAFLHSNSSFPFLVLLGIICNKFNNFYSCCKCNLSCLQYFVESVCQTLNPFG